jgi:dihydrofolate synthase/folylpolyglutamate synthase
MRFHTLEQWLEWQQTLHPKVIDLSLERVRRVLAVLDPPRAGVPVVTVAGTNGKGSVVALLDAVLRAAGYSVGTFTSPHLVRYNERVRVNGRAVDDDVLLDSFARIDSARGDVSLTYFEFSALAALDCFARAHVDVQVLEVGLGGRLDAVNAVDADVAVVTTIGLDHCEWLGPDEESIGREKAGIFRAGRPAIYGARRMPDSIAAVASTCGARLRRLGVDFDFVERPDAWDFVAAGTTRRDLPLPSLPGAVQLDNAAAALAALVALEPAILVPDYAVRAGLTAARLAGRFQVVPGPVQWILDVAHNPQAAQALAARLVAQPFAGRTLFVCGILGDKDVEGVAAALSAIPGDWFAAGLDGPRALPAGDLSARLRAVLERPVQACPDVRTALGTAREQARPGDRVVVFGSFLTVGPALQWLDLEAD